MATDTQPASDEPSFFEQQRAHLASEIAQSMEHVLQNINKLNRSLEGVIAVGNEFANVEALWSQFENVMAPRPATNTEGVGSAAAGTAAEQRTTEGGGEVQGKPQTSGK